MATVATKPALLVPRLQARITFTPVTGNFVRVWVTDAPPGSDLRRELDKLPHGLDPLTNEPIKPRLLLTELREVKADNRTSFEWTLTPDKGGKYLLAIQEYQKGTDFGGGFSDDPDALQKEVEVNDAATYALTVGQVLTIPIGVPPDVATLRICAHDSQIRATSLEVHGVYTPALVEPESARARAAATSEAVTDVLAALVDSSTGTFGSLASAVTDLMTRFNAHRTQAGVHGEDDEFHAVSPDYYGPDSPLSLEQAIAELHRRLTLHVQNQDSDAYGVGRAGYHDSVDWTGLPGPMGGNALSQIADLWRAFEAHRVSDVHAIEGGDNVNSAAPLPPLLELARQFVTVTAASSPLTPPTSAGRAVTVLVHEFGFEETPL